MSCAKYFGDSPGFILLSMLSVASFAGDQPASEKDVARIRLFGQNAVMVKYYPGSKCVGGNSVSVSGGMGDAFSSFLGTAKNQSIGMPESPNTRNLAARDGIMSKAYYREYEIAAGEPVTIAMGFREARAAVPMVMPGTSVNANTPALGSVSCRTIATTFVPEKGKNYEGALDIHSSADVCVQTIHEVTNTANGVALTLVPVAKAESCEQ